MALTPEHMNAMHEWDIVAANKRIAELEAEVTRLRKALDSLPMEVHSDEKTNMEPCVFLDNGLYQGVFIFYRSEAPDLYDYFASRAALDGEETNG